MTTVDQYFLKDQLKKAIEAMTQEELQVYFDKMVRSIIHDQIEAFLDLKLNRKRP